MLRRDLISGIRRSWDVLDQLGIGLTFSVPTPLGVLDEFRDLVLDNSSAYVEIYLSGLRNSHYNFILSEYSFFQFTHSDDGVRYAFYPNTFNASQEMAVLGERLDEGELTYEDYLSSLRDASVELRVPPIRYENSPGQYRGLGHPCSHFHIGHHSENRWAVRRTLTPFAFTLIILKQYYAAEWAEGHRDVGEEPRNAFDRALIEEKLNCRIVADTHFSNIEARGFFFGQ